MAALFAVSASVVVQTFLLKLTEFSVLTQRCVHVQQAKADKSGEYFSGTVIFNSNCTAWQNSLDVFYSVILRQELDCNSRWSKLIWVENIQTLPTVSPLLPANAPGSCLELLQLRHRTKQQKPLTLRALLGERRRNTSVWGRSSWAWWPR